MKKEDLAGVMKEAMEDVLKPINERLDRIEKSETGGEQGEEVADSDIASIVKAAVSEFKKSTKRNIYSLFDVKQA